MFERPHAVWTFPAVASVAWNVIAVSIGAMALYYYMLNHGTAGRVAANFYLIPGTVALLGWALLGERLTPLADARLRHCLGRGLPGGPPLERRSSDDKGPSASLAPSAAGSTYRKYASPAAFGRRLAAGPFSSL